MLIAKYTTNTNGVLPTFEGKYYMENDVLYLCNRNSGTPICNALKDLVNIYVTIV